MPIILTLLGIIIIIFSLSSLIKESRNSQLNNFQVVYENKKEDISDIDLKIGEMRTEFAETILELQQEIIDLRERTSTAKDIDSQDKQVEENTSESSETSTEKESVYNSVRVNDIQKLYQQGYSIDQISEELGISKGEILLIKDLYLK
ncbi:MAG TPA: hypothetical protein DGK91_03250 [Clostridium sp.]|jgi:hypothetical protein|nr:hypothetical protein [Clostridia bacterium]HCW03631.1 hypothetical protein [Clostridium sp.]